jgi:hypothetical protein
MYETDGITHMLVVCNIFDYEDYPVYINEDENPREYVAGSMQWIMECYSKKHEKLVQLQEYRCHNYD